MFAAIMDGMHSQREKNTTNRRTSAKLFNEHLKNQADLGIEVTEESLSDAWNANSGGVMQRHAPTQQRLQGIVTAQNKTLADKQAIDSFNLLKQNREIDAFIKQDIEDAMTIRSTSGNTQSDEEFYAQLQSPYADNPVMSAALGTMTGNGLRLRDMQKSLDAAAQSPMADQIVKMVNGGFRNAKALKDAYPQVDPALIDALVAEGVEAKGQQRKQFSQADTIYQEGRTTFQNQQVVFDQNQQASILAAAQLAVKTKHNNTFDTMTLVEKTAAIEAAKEAVIRKVLENSQDDMIYGEGRISFANNISKAIKDAEREVVEQAQQDDTLSRTNTQTDIVNQDQNAIRANTVGTIGADNLASANSVIDRQVSANLATKESVTQALSSYTITDQATIDDVWNLTNVRQSRSIMQEMTKVNLMNTDKMAKKEAEISTLILEDVKTNQDNLANHIAVVEGVTEQVKSAAVLVAARFNISGDEIFYFQDFVAKKIKEGTWDEASSQQVAQSMEEFAATRNPTFASKRAMLVAQAKNQIGPDQYTPLAFEAKYVFDTSSEFDAHLMSMQTAIENSDPIGFAVGKGGVTSLIIEMQADLKQRQSLPQQAFGSTATEEEVLQAIEVMQKLLADSAASAGNMVAPVEEVKEAEVIRQFAPNLYKASLTSTGDIKTIDDAVSVIQGNINDKTGNRQRWDAMFERITNAQARFPELVEAYDLEQAKLDLKPEKYEEIALKASLKEKAAEIRVLQGEVGRVIDSLN